ncbi:LysR family transcriptional regulator [Acetobacter malorum DSM 14337]|uniref:LysR family transcriptional regulator n=1 Tax=Acetobacter malorum DSM 14337 TaxID=1307910 RepID=A0ABQ0PT70_9PROT|nr:LysR family transcriptional regulator [Acetobacter malorum]GBQ80460.1 LysR family transcriptional regulator [Acetobacter malorum DSM 14337]
MMDIKWLEDFLALARLQSFSKAAEERNVTQSAFSRRIQALELWVGVALIDRTRYPASLTAEGMLFRETAKETIRLLNAGKNNLQRQPDDRIPPVSVAALHTIAITFFPLWLQKTEDAVGPLYSRLLSDDFYNCISALSEGEYDFLLCFYNEGMEIPLDDNSYIYKIVGSDSFVPVILKEIYKDNDTVYPLLSYSENSLLGQLSHSARSKTLHVLTEERHLNESAMAEALKHMVFAGHGVAWLPKSLVSQELQQGLVIAVGEELPLELRLYRKVGRRSALTEKIWLSQSVPEYHDAALC